MQPGRGYAARKPGYGIGVEKRRLAWLQLRRSVPVATLHSIARGNRCQREVSGVGTRCAAHHHSRIEPRGYLRQFLEHLARSFVLRSLQIGVNLVVACVELFRRLALATRSCCRSAVAVSGILAVAHARELVCW